MTLSPRAPIYDAITRTDCHPQLNGETTFSFYNRVSGDYWEECRNLQQAWADGVALDRDYREMRAALRGSDEAQARSAYLELYLHEALRRTFQSVVVHPDVPDRTRHPDFLVSRPDLDLFVEATLPAGTKEEKAATARLAKVLAALDQVGDPNFFLWVEEMVEGPESPSGAKIRDDIRRWLKDLDPDSINVDPGADALPKRHWTQGSWSGDVMAIPKNPDARERTDRSIGVYGHTPIRVIDDAPKLRRALNQKARAYGHLGKPFVIAIGTYLWDSDDWQVKDTLYGHSSLAISGLNNNALRTRPFTQNDGFFGEPGDWRNRRVSGVLVVNQLSQHNPLLAQVDLWLHPAATHPLPDIPLFPGSIRTVDENGPTSTDALDARTLFGLPADWPSGEPWDRSVDSAAQLRSATTTDD